MSQVLIAALEEQLDQVTAKVLDVPYSQMDPDRQEDYANYFLKSIHNSLELTDRLPSARDNDNSTLERQVTLLAQVDYDLFMQCLSLITKNYQKKVASGILDDTLKNYKISLTQKDSYDPFTLTPDMIQKALTITSREKSEEQRARDLYNFLGDFKYSKNNGLQEPPETLTARVGNCNEQTRLFIAMGRAVDLNTGYTSVLRDYIGSRVNHACAWAELNHKIKYIDFTYDGGWDIHHKEISRLSDDEVRRKYSSLYQTKNGGKK